MEWEATPLCDCDGMPFCAGVALLSFDIYDGLPVQRLPLQRAGQTGNADADGEEEPDGARLTCLCARRQAESLLNSTA